MIEDTKKYNGHNYSGVLLQACFDGYKQGKTDMLEDLAEPSLRETIIESHCKLLQTYARKGQWKAVYNCVLDMFQFTCKWSVADDYTEHYDRTLEYADMPATP